MSCLIELCFVSLVYINGGIGIQNKVPTNDYGIQIGELSLVVEMGDHWYVEAKHISGLNTPEPDGGLNAIMFGARINLWDNR